MTGLLGLIKAQEGNNALIKEYFQLRLENDYLSKKFKESQRMEINGFGSLFNRVFKRRLDAVFSSVKTLGDGSIEDKIQKMFLVLNEHLVYNKIKNTYDECADQISDYWTAKFNHAIEYRNFRAGQNKAQRVLRDKITRNGISSKLLNTYYGKIKLNIQAFNLLKGDLEEEFFDVEEFTQDMNIELLEQIVQDVYSAEIDRVDNVSPESVREIKTIESIKEIVAEESAKRARREQAKHTSEADIISILKELFTAQPELLD